MGSYAYLAKAVIGALLVVLGSTAVAYGVYLYEERSFEQERSAYRNEIAETHVEKEKLAVKATERKAAEAFQKVEEHIDKASTVTRNHTREKIQDETVTDFTDTF